MPEPIYATPNPGQNVANTQTEPLQTNNQRILNSNLAMQNPGLTNSANPTQTPTQQFMTTSSPNSNMKGLESAPSPKQAETPRANGQVDFNQIYGSYQSQYGQYDNGLQPVMQNVVSSLNTSIVTPKPTGEPLKDQYQSQYASTVNSIIAGIIQSTAMGFNYAPERDTALKAASEYAANTTLNSLAGSGVLNSSMTSERVAKVVADLIPEFEQLRYNQWHDQIQMLGNIAELAQSQDAFQFNIWADQQDRLWKQKLQDYQEKRDAIEDAWDKVETQGYVDNEASKVLGLPAGTLSKDARIRKEEYEYAIKQAEAEAEINLKYTSALNKIKMDQQLEYDAQKSALDYEYAMKQYQEKSALDYAYNMAEFQEKSAINYGYDIAKLHENAKYEQQKMDAQYQYDLAGYQAKAATQFAYDNAAAQRDYQYKSALASQEAKNDIAAYQAKRSIDLDAKISEYQLQRAGYLPSASSSSSSTSKTSELKYYKDIIDNTNWVVTDDETGKTRITNRGNMPALEYIQNQQASGNMSAQTANDLMKYYGITTVPNQASMDRFYEIASGPVIKRIKGEEGGVSIEKMSELLQKKTAEYLAAGQITEEDVKYLAGRWEALTGAITGK